MVFVFKDPVKEINTAPSAPNQGTPKGTGPKASGRKKSAAFEKEHKSQYQNHREIHGRNGKNCLAIHSREIKLRPSQPKTVPYR